MDSNSYFGNSDSKVCKMMRQHHIIDCITYLNPSLDKTPTYKYGTKRIDSIVESSKMKAGIKGSGLIQYDEIVDTNHRGVWYDLC